MLTQDFSFDFDNPSAGSESEDSRSTRESTQYDEKVKQVRLDAGLEDRMIEDGDFNLLHATPSKAIDSLTISDCNDAVVSVWSGVETSTLSSALPDELTYDALKIPARNPNKTHNVTTSLDSPPSLKCNSPIRADKGDVFQSKDYWSPPGGRTTPTEDFVFPRRSNFDILAQLKAESANSEFAFEGKSQGEDFDRLISVMEKNDLEPGFYEGGFKTWEGAWDLAVLVNRIDFFRHCEDWHIIELGAGSAIPSMVAFTRILKDGQNPRPGQSTNNNFLFELQDYNKEVIQFSTWPNVLLTSSMAQLEADDKCLTVMRPPPLADGKNGTLVIDYPGLHERTFEFWQTFGGVNDYQVGFNLLAGPWGKILRDSMSVSGQSSLERVDVAYRDPNKHYLNHRRKNLLILSSETVYEEKTLPAFAKTVLILLRRHGVRSKAWIAAKKMYFGVGGGVAAFTREINTRGGHVKEIMTVEGGVKRVVLEVTGGEAESFNNTAPKRENFECDCTPATD